MATKKEMFDEIIKITPKVIRLAYKNAKPDYKEVREALVAIKFELKTNQREYDVSLGDHE